MPTRTIEYIRLPASAMGNARSLTLFRYGNRSNGRKAYIQAGLHADEAPGYLVMHHLMEKLDRVDRRDAITGEILMVPVANPIGVSQWRDENLSGRFDFFDSINFNRCYPDIAEPIARQIEGRLASTPEANIGLIRKTAGEVLQAMTPDNEGAHLKQVLLSMACDADIVLDLHCDHQALVHVYLGTPLWPEASDLSAQMGAEVTLLAEDSGVTPFDEACSRLWWRLAGRFPDYPIPLACLAATVELRGAADVNHRLADGDAENIFLFLQRRGLIAGEAPAVPGLVREATPLAAVEQVKANAPGVVVFARRPGDSVSSGDVVAEIVNPSSSEGEGRVHAVRSSIDGILFARSADRFARPGRILAKIAGEKPLRREGENLLTP